jgi:hypothetical protein
MTVRGRMDLNLGPLLEALATAGQDVDQAVTEVLEDMKINALTWMTRQLYETSETWTGATAKTLYAEGPFRDGNYIYIELGAHTDKDPSALYKEYGKPTQPAEPFLRPTLLYYKRGGLKQPMEAVLERLGVSK